MDSTRGIPVCRILHWCSYRTMTKVCCSVWIWAKVNDMAHGKDPEQRLAVIDYEYGEYVAFLAGSIMVKVREIVFYFIL